MQFALRHKSGGISFPLFMPPRSCIQKNPPFFSLEFFLDYLYDSPSEEIENCRYIMNWTHHTATPAAVLRSALLFCALLLSTQDGLADPLEIDNTGLLTITGDGTTVTTLTSTIIDGLVAGHAKGLRWINVESDAILEIARYTMVHLEGGYISVQGTLRLESTIGTGIYSGEKWWDPGDNKPITSTYLFIDGGTIEITKGLNEYFFADSINVTLGVGGGTINIAADVTFESGTISGQTGDATKDGAGTFRVNTVNMGGVFNVLDGEVVFLNGATVGALNSNAGTTINGLQADGKGRADLTIISGGDIKGELRDIGFLGLANGKLTFEDGFHTIDQIGIANGATLEIGIDTDIQLGSAGAEETYDDIIVQGTLSIASTDVKIYKGDPSNSDPTYITLVGSTNPNNGNVAGGIVEIKKSGPPERPEEFRADTLHTKVVGIGQIIVEKGVTFQSGTIGLHSGDTGAHVVVSGGGTYKVAEVDLGDGYFVVESGMTVDFLKTVTAEVLIGNADAQINTHGNAVFTFISLAGNYAGNSQDLTLRQGGWVMGSITGVKDLKMEKGTLLLSVDDTATPTIQTQTWTIDDPANTQIRTLVGTQSGSYQNVIQITDSDSDRNQLLAILNDSRTALYRPQWSQAGTYLNLEVDILTVDEYLHNVWNRKGRNVDNIVRFIGGISAQDVSFREYLEGLTDAQLQDMIHNVLAGELAGNAFRIAMHQPAHSVFRQFDTAAPLRSPFNIRGQSKEGFRLWLNPYGQTEHAKGDAGTFDGYNAVRYGFQIGSDIEIYNRIVLGGFFGYAVPSVKSDLGKISANDYTGGLYVRMPAVWNVVTNMMVGFGSQDYSYKNAYGSTDFRGSSLFGSVELTRPTPLPSFQSVKLTPLVALDLQSADMDGFFVYDATLGGVWIEPDSVSSAAVRLGLLGNFGRFRTRLQYTRQISGDDCASSQIAAFGEATQVQGVQWGKDRLNVGVGGELWRVQHFRLFADYNFDVGKHTTSHLGALNFVVEW